MKEIIGIDVSKRRFDVALLNSGKHRSYEYCKKEMNSFVRSLDTLQPERIVMEATGGYEKPLLKHLQKHELPVVVVNPRRIRDFARAMGVAVTYAAHQGVFQHPVSPFGCWRIYRQLLV